MLGGSDTIQKAIDVKVKLIISAIIKEATTFIVSTHGISMFIKFRFGCKHIFLFYVKTNITLFTHQNLLPLNGIES